MADYTSSLTGQQMDAALTDMAMHNSEAWAVGRRNGIAVTSDDETYNNNSRYWASRASAFNTSAQDAAARAEAAIPVGSESAVLFDRAQSLTDAQKKQAKDNIGATGSANYNLIDNGWFTVREYGAGPFTGAVSFANRWDSTATYNSVTFLSIRGVRLENAIGQGANINQVLRYRGSEINGRMMTLSVLTSSGVQSASGVFNTSGDGYKISLTFGADNEWYCRLGWYANVSELYPFVRLGKISSATSATIDIYAVKLELGNQSTLSNDVRPDYRTEADKCHDYDLVFGAGSSSLYTMLAYCVSANGVYKASLPFDMRGTPTVTFTGSATVYSASGAHTVSSISLDRIGINAMQINIAVGATPAPVAGEIGNVSFAANARVAFKIAL